MRKPLSGTFWLTIQTVAASCFAVLALSLLDGALPQLEMAVTGGHVFVPMVVLKVLLLALLAVCAVFSGPIPAPSRFTIVWLAACVYLLADCFFLLTKAHVPFTDIALAYNSYYAYLLIAPMSCFLAGRLSERWATLFLTLAFLLCWVVGTAQFAAQRPLIYIESIEENFVAAAAYSGDAEGGFRAFSLFTSGLAYGTVCSLMGAIGLGLLLKSSHKISGATLFTVSALGCYTTLTRNCYIEFGFACVAVLCLAVRQLKGIVKYLPIVFLMGSVIIAVRGIATDVSDSAITSNVSLLIRAASWQYYLNLFLAAPLSEKLFGLGIVQNATAATDAIFAVDNEFLAVLLNAGLAGFALLFWLQWEFWIRLYKRAVLDSSPLNIGAAGFWSTFLAVFFYNISLAPFCLVYMLVILVEVR